MKKFSLFLFIVALMCACSVKDSNVPEGDINTPDIADGDYEGGGMDGEMGGAGGAGEAEVDGQEYAGRVTAGEWRDLDHWLYWADLMTSSPDQTGFSYGSYCEYWGLFTNNRVAVRVANEAGEPQRDVEVKVLRNGNAVYSGRTDNKGEVNLFVGLTQKEENVEASALQLNVNGVALEQEVSVTHWGEEVGWNECTASVTPTVNIDIAFIVDATGSMTDEINFLKADLTSIINTVRSGHSDASIRTAALFYRDEGDEYLTRVNDFSANLSETTSFIEQQNADGGGDYPEAVHTALEVGLQQLSWRKDHSIRLAFMLLDAPPHKQSDVIMSLQRTIPQYASHGIRIIPVAASGVDKPTEFFLRFTAIATDATYVFLTNHSGVGGDHIEATVGDYDVELLSDLIVRLINQYME